MDTKKKILDVALTLFSEKGYGNVYVGQIAEGVGIKAPSLYKHYKSKQDIFNAILVEMRERYNQKATDLNLNGNDILIDSEVYKNASEDDLVKMGTGLFSFFLHDEYECKFRKMLTLEQFSDKELADLFSNQYFDQPLKYQSGMLQFLIMQGKLKGDDADIICTAFMILTVYHYNLHLSSPLYILLNCLMCFSSFCKHSFSLSGCLSHTVMKR